MIPFLNRNIEMVGSVFFRGTMQPRAEEFDSLKERGFEIAEQKQGDGGGWVLKLSHPKVGDAMLVSLKDPMLPPPFIIQMDPWLSPQEAEAVAGCGSMLSIQMKGKKNNILRDRKNMLRVMAAVMGREGVACLDHLAERFWSRAELRDELSHNADLDIGSLFTTHMVSEDGEYAEDEDPPICWYHTHGLSSLGLWDFDIMAPGEPSHPGFFDHARVLAFGMMAGDAKPGGAFHITSKHAVTLVDANTFHAKAGSKWNAMRDHDESHSDKRVVLCEAGGKLSRLMGKGVEPSRWLRKPMDESALHQFTKEASELMADRARKTFDQLRKIDEQMEAIDRMTLVKIRYKIDGAGPEDDSYEHMWHEVHELGEGRIDATLLNQPFNVAGVNAGDRKTHGLDDLSDWMVMSPLGMVTPRYQTPYRLFRENKAEILAVLAEAEASGEM